MTDDKSNAEDLTSTLVGMEPVDVDDFPEEGTQPEMAPVRRPRAPDEPAFLPEPPKDLRATNSGKALFFHGPPGNGKTAICERMAAGPWSWWAAS